MECNLDKKIKFVIIKKTAIINLVIKAKFFYIICKILFISLLAINKIKKKLLKLILNDFAVIKINKYKILYLHCFI